MSEKNKNFPEVIFEKVEAYYGIKKEDIIPFAGNVNPLGISPLLKKSMASHIESISEYPDRDYKELSFHPCTLLQCPNRTYHCWKWCN